MVNGKLSPTYQRLIYRRTASSAQGLYIQAAYEGRLQDDIKVVERVEDVCDEGDEVMVTHERLLLVHLGCHDVPGYHGQPLLNAVIPAAFKL